MFFNCRLIDVLQFKLKIYDISLILFPLSIYLFGGQSFIHAMGMWTFILIVGSFFWGMIGIHAAHRHPDLFHDGDQPR